MSLLDDLKRQVEELQNSTELQTEESRQDALYQEKLRPRMRAIFCYLMELTEQLKLVDPNVRHSYSLPGIGDAKDLKQGGYILNADSTDQTKTIRLRFHCMAEREGSYAIQPKAKADETRDFLEAQTMRYAEWPMRDSAQQIIGLNFQLQIKVNIDCVFQADPEQGVIRMITSNFNEFAVERRVVKPEHIDELWLDKLGHYLLRKDQNLHKLEINDAHKALIRERLAADNRARQQELANQPAAAEPERKSKAGLLGKLRNFTKR
jgi:hypothetical protein